MRRVTIGVLAVGLAVVTASAELARAAAPESAAPAWREITIPAGTRLAIVLDSSVGSDTTRVEEPVTAQPAFTETNNGTNVQRRTRGNRGERSFLRLPRVLR